MSSPGVAYFKTKKAGVSMHVVQADISRTDVNVAVVTAAGGIGSLESWSGLIHRSGPAAAITGTYFDTLSGIPVGSIGVDGHLVHKNTIGTAFTFSQNSGAGIHFARPYESFDFGDALTFLRAGPRLVTDCRATLYPKDEGFRDPSVFARAKRTAIATTTAGKLLLVATEKPILLREWATALVSLGAEDAMCLDGGSSTGLYHEGRSWIVPRRQLTNLLIVYSSEERYQERLPFLNRPSGL